MSMPLGSPALAGAAAEAAEEEDDGAAAAQPSWDAFPYLAPRFGPAEEGQPALPSPPHFVAECFFITSQLMHTCVVPAGASRQRCARTPRPSYLSVYIFK